MQNLAYFSREVIVPDTYPRCVKKDALVLPAYSETTYRIDVFRAARAQSTYQLGGHHKKFSMPIHPNASESFQSLIPACVGTLGCQRLGRTLYLNGKKYCL